MSFYFWFSFCYCCCFFCYGKLSTSTIYAIITWHVKCSILLLSFFCLFFPPAYIWVYTYFVIVYISAKFAYQTLYRLPLTIFFISYWTWTISFQKISHQKQLMYFCVHGFPFHANKSKRTRTTTTTAHFGPVMSMANCQFSIFIHNTYAKCTITMSENLKLAYVKIVKIQAMRDWLWFTICKQLLSLGSVSKATIFNFFRFFSSLSLEIFRIVGDGDNDGI